MAAANNPTLPANPSIESLLVSDLAPLESGGAPPVQVPSTPPPAQPPVTPAASEPASPVHEPAVTPPAEASPVPEAKPVDANYEYEVDLDHDPLEEAPQATEQPEAAAKPEAVQGEKPLAHPAIPELEAVLAKFTDSDALDAARGVILNKTPKGQRIWRNFKILDTVAKPVEEGGLGFEPTAKDIIDGLDALRAEREVVHDFASGEPERIAKWTGHWFNPEHNFETDDQGQPLLDPVSQQPVMGVALRAAAKLPYILSKVNPDAYRAVAHPIIQGALPRLRADITKQTVSGILTRLQQLATGDPNEGDRPGWAYLHENLSKNIEFILQPKAAGAPPAAPGTQPSADPEVARLRAENERLTKRATEAETNSRRAATEQSERAVDSRLFNTLTVEVTKALEPVKHLYSKSDFQIIVNHEATNIANLVWQNPAASILKIRRTEAINGRADKALVDPLVREFRQRYAPVLKAKASERIREISASIPGRSADDAAKLKLASERVSASPSGVAPVLPVAANGRPEPKPGESAEIFRERMLLEDLTRAVA